MSQLTILSKEIRQFDGLFSLNDLHKASGAEEKHQPNQFTRRGQTKGLISEIEQSAKSLTALKIKIGGTAPGSYACKEIVVAYASWISPKIHLAVIQAFLNNQPAAKAIPQAEPETVTLTKDEYLDIMCEHNALLKDKVSLLELQQTTQSRRSNLTENERDEIDSRDAMGQKPSEIGHAINRSTSTIRTYLRNKGQRHE